MPMPNYIVLIEPPLPLEPGEERDGEPAYGAIVPSLPGCVSLGRTIEEALTNVREAIALHLEGLAGRGEDIPDDRAVVMSVVQVDEPAAERVAATA
jgi:predicted RNase H-like HicB family nuclease